MQSAFNPSQMVDIHHIHCDSIATAAVHDLIPSPGGIDCSPYEHVMLLVAVFDGDFVYDVKLQESDSATTGYADVVGGPTLNLSATNDNNLKAIELRVFGRKKFLNPVITTSVGTTGGASVTLLGFKRQYSADVGSLTSIKAPLVLD